MAMPGTVPATSFGAGGGGGNTVSTSGFLTVRVPGPVVDTKTQAWKAQTKFGEIIGYRYWRVVDPESRTLVSMAINRLWQYGSPSMTGDPEMLDEGVHAFADPGWANTYIRRSDLNPNLLGYPMLVFGKVHLWGTVIEHKLGYRAEYAKPLEFIQAWGVGATYLLPAFRKAYGV